jgi:hypothetical protein
MVAVNFLSVAIGVCLVVYLIINIIVFVVTFIVLSRDEDTKKPRRNDFPRVLR